MAEKMIEKQIKSALPIYIAAMVFLLCALIFPIYKLWAIVLAAVLTCAAYGVAEKKVPRRTILVPAPVVKYATGDAQLDVALTKADADLGTLSVLNDRIPDAQLSGHIDRMEKAGRSILTAVEKEPKKANLIRKFVSYYLPTSVKLLTTYADLTSTGAQGTNAQSLMDEIKKNAGIIATAFEAQLDALFADKVLDVSSDITVLDGMMRGDGLAGADAIGKAAGRGTVAPGIAGTLARDIAAGAAPGVNTNGSAQASLAADLAKDGTVTPHLTL
ncbi:MAG: 5-bromo-4-chloroindolyl phosphate hydrolysis family protein [Ruthenibacterium sp.]